MAPTRVWPNPEYEWDTFPSYGPSWGIDDLFPCFSNQRILMHNPPAGFIEQESTEPEQFSIRSKRDHFQKVLITSYPYRDTMWIFLNAL